MPGQASNAPSRFGPGSKKDVALQQSRVAGGGRMTSAVKKRNTTMTGDAQTRAAGEMRARNIEGHAAMTAKAKAAIEAAARAARKSPRVISTIVRERPSPTRKK